MKPLRKTPRHTDRLLTHNERPCTGQHCAECTPSTKTPQHRADDETESAA